MRPMRHPTRITARDTARPRPTTPAARRWCWLTALVSLAVLLPPATRTAQAHPESMAFWRVSLDVHGASSEVLIPLPDVAADGVTPHGPVDAATLSAEHREKLATQWLAHFEVIEAGTPVPASLVSTALLPFGMLQVRARHATTGPIDTLALRSTFHTRTDDTHRVMTRVDHRGAAARGLLTAAAPEMSLAAIATPGEASARGNASPGSLVRLGVEHILTGYDHLVFLLCLLVPGGTWRSRVGIVSAFTLAHSLTLVLAAMQILTPPAHLVEIAIAFSIAYVAVENLVRPGASARWPMAFAFGLVHGFGFAGMLQVLDRPVGQWLASVVAFNVGVEVGQLAVVAVAAPLLALAARQAWHRRMVQWTSLGVFGLAAFWVVERLP